MQRYAKEETRRHEGTAAAQESPGSANPWFDITTRCNESEWRSGPETASALTPKAVRRYRVASRKRTFDSYPRRAPSRRQITPSFVIVVMISWTN